MALLPKWTAMAHAAGRWRRNPGEHQPQPQIDDAGRGCCRGRRRTAGPRARWPATCRPLVGDPPEQLGARNERSSPSGASTQAENTRLLRPGRRRPRSSRTRRLLGDRRAPAAACREAEGVAADHGGAEVDEADRGRPGRQRRLRGRHERRQGPGFDDAAEAVVKEGAEEGGDRGQRQREGDLGLVRRGRPGGRTALDRRPADRRRPQGSPGITTTTSVGEAADPRADDARW